ncbi:MAG TPA: hypothetical protein VKS79_25575 [Gemmataceae bacterium]|nr:hypothetical protein [Gemmataceae bacterium]
MRSVSFLGAMLVSLGLAFNVFAADEKKDSKEPKESPSASSYVSVNDVTVVISGASSNSVSIKVQGYKGNAKRPQATTQDDELTFTSDVVIRQRHLPPKLDEKGKKIAYTSEELQKLKGKGGVGYEASPSDLHTGQTVSLHLVKLKGAKGEDANKLYVSKIIIESEPPPHPQDQAKKPDKKP